MTFGSVLLMYLPSQSSILKMRPLTILVLNNLTPLPRNKCSSLSFWHTPTFITPVCFTVFGTYLLCLLLDSYIFLHPNGSSRKILRIILTFLVVLTLQKSATRQCWLKPKNCKESYTGISITSSLKMNSHFLACGLLFLTFWSPLLKSIMLLKLPRSCFGGTLSKS